MNTFAIVWVLNIADVIGWSIAAVVLAFFFIAAGVIKWMERGQSSRVEEPTISRDEALARWEGERNKQLIEAEQKRLLSEILPKNSDKTLRDLMCEWENVAPAGCCGNTAAYTNRSGKRLCVHHAEHLKRRFGAAMTKIAPTPLEGPV